MKKSNKRFLCYLVKENKILLGEKLEGIGKGNYVGIGGKAQSGETPDQAVKRETKEEIGVVPIKLEQVIELEFVFPHQPTWSQTIIGFRCEKWNGKPKSTSEIKPTWFTASKLPFDKMWDDAFYWLPLMLKGKKLKARFVYNKANLVEKLSLKIL